MIQGSKPQRTRPRLLVVTTTFPRRPHDSEPDFVWQLCEQLADEFRVIVLAPSGRGLKSVERMGKSIVVRWRYAPTSLETLAYSGGMSERIKAQPGMWLLVPFFLAGLIVRAVSLFRQHSFAAAHVHWVFPTLPAILLARGLAFRPQVPVACTAHGADVHGFRSPWLLKIKSWALRRCSRIAAVSGALARRVDLDCPKLRINILPMGIRPCPPKPSYRRRPGDLIFVGRLVEKKGADTAVSVIAELHRRQRDVHLSIIGDGPERAHVENLVFALGIGDRVSFLGAVPGPEASAYLANAGIALLPFRTAKNGDAEGLGLVILEALAGGCPVITSDTEITRSFLTSERHALLAKPDKVSEFADAVEATLDGYEQALERTLRADREILGKYRWESVGRAYCDWLREMTTETSIRWP